VPYDFDDGLFGYLLGIALIGAPPLFSRLLACQRGDDRDCDHDSRQPFITPCAPPVLRIRLHDPDLR
jgi:hypothetical protein